MAGIIRSGAASLLLVVASWRLTSELVARSAVLRRTGRITELVQQRDARRISRALAREGILVDPRRVVLASVHVGGIRAGDIDDVGLLEGAMRRAARDRIGADGRASRRVEAPGRSAEDWAWLAASTSAGDHAPDGGRRAPAWAVAMVAAGAVLTLVPLVRPLGDAAPWLAAASLALVAAGALAARR